MSRIEGYSIYQNSYNKDFVQNKKEAEKTKKTEKKEERQIQLSDKAKALLEELKKTYGNMDFMVADYETEEEAARYLSRGTKEYSVLIDPDTLEEMAGDDSVKEKYMGIINDATSQFETAKEQLGEEGKEVVRMGVTVGKDGTITYFAELEKMSEAQKARIEKVKEEKKEEKQKAEAKEEREERTGKSEEKYIPEARKRTRLQAASMETLIEQIKGVDWDHIKMEDLTVTGSRLDLSI